MRSTLSTLALLLALIGLAACGAESDTGSGTSTTEKPGTTTDGDGGTETAEADGPPEECPTVETTWRGDGTTIEFTAWEMGCSGCESTIQKRLTAIDGVTEVTADHTTATIKVELDDAAKRDAVIEKIVPALEKPESGRKFDIVRGEN